MMEEAAVALDLEATAPMKNRQTVEAATAGTGKIDLETMAPIEENHQTVKAETDGTAEIDLETTAPMEENYQTVEVATAGTAEIDLETTASMEENHQTVEMAIAGIAEINLETTAPMEENHQIVVAATSRTAEIDLETTAPMENHQTVEAETAGTAEIDLETTAPMEENYQTVEAATAGTAEIDLETTAPMEENYQAVEAATAGTAEIDLETTVPMEENHQIVEAATSRTAEINLETTAPMKENHQIVEAATSRTAEIDLETTAPMEENHQIVEAATSRTAGIDLETTAPMEENHQTVEAATAGTAEIDLETTAPMEETHQTVEAATTGTAEIDTSAPFLSVREAVDRFGGIAVWKSQLRELFHPEKLNCPEDVNEAISMEEQAAQLEMDLILKEKETLNVLQELEMTKRIVDALKLRLQKGVPEATKMPVGNSDDVMIQSVPETEEHHPSGLEEDVGSQPAVRRIPVELKQVKENLTKTASDLADIRTSIDVLNMKIQEEKLLLEKSQEKLTVNAALISSLEEDLIQTATELERAKDFESENCEDSSNILQEIKQFNSEASELASEIEHTKASIKTVELRGFAARKMEEAAKAAEAMALADIKALICSNKAILDLQNTCAVTLSMEEYMALASKAQEADLNSRKKLQTVMLEVDKVNMSKSQLLTKVEEAMTEAKKCKKALEDALKRAEVASRAKLEVEDALRRWRSEHGHQSRNAYNSTKFKKSSSSSGQLSIGQILSMKLAGPESLEQHEMGSWEKENEKPSVSLGQMLNKRHGVCLMSQRLDENRHLSIKRTKLGFVGLPHLLVKQGKKNMKKRHSSSIE